MARELVSAHDALDRVVDKAFEIGRARIDEAARQTVLFEPIRGGDYDRQT